MTDTLQFTDSFAASLPPGTYTLKLSHTLSNTGAPVPAQSQNFTVVAPEFTIDPSIVRAVYPQNGDNAGTTYCLLPHIVLDDEGLPWERPLGAGQPATTPWMALMVFAEGEITSVSSITVSDLLALGQSGSTIGPAIDPGNVLPSVLSSQCQTITISGSTFNAVMPPLTDLPLMAHCESISSAAEGVGNVSVLLANRMPIDPSTNAPMQFYAHLVSLEGFAGNLGNPVTAASVQMVTLYNWSFLAVPESPLNFESLAIRLSAGPLALPFTPPSGAPPEAGDRINDGYAPLEFVTTSGDQTFGWYRGPFTAAVAQPLPQVGGNPPVPASAATNADELMIYSETYGLFDLSYSAAWNFGRAYALADAHFAQQLSSAQGAILRAAATLAQKMSLPHLAGIDDPRELLARDAARRRFAALMGEGLGRSWRDALRHPSPRASRRRTRRAPHPRQLLARDDVRRAIAESTSDSVAPILAWLGSLFSLVPLPFSHLVPNPGMLPVESIRFFYIDPAWLDALIAGATSIALQGAGSLAATALIREQFFSQQPPLTYPAAGLLLRSQLVSGWPKLVISASKQGNAVTTLRDDTLSSNVRLLLFDQVPDSVTLGEPYHGIQLGMDLDTSNNLTVTPRSTTTGEPSGGSPVTPGFMTPPEGAVGGVFDVNGLATALGVSTAGDFGLQMIRVPYEITFSNQS